MTNKIDSFIGETMEKLDGPKHTPGPWHRNIKPASRYPVVFAGRNIHVAVIERQGLSESEIEGNCALIAAAPELLEALEAMVEDFTTSDPELITIRRNALTVIAKAKQAKGEPC